MAPHSRTVAVVDFDAGVRTQVQTMLEGEGFSVLTGSTRADARALLEESDPDLLIIGLFLSDGPAYEIFTERAREDVPIVGLTHVLQGPTVRRMLKLRYGFLELLDKPLSGANLIDLMRVHFGSRYPRPATSQAVDDANRAASGFQHERPITQSGVFAPVDDEGTTRVQAEGETNRLDRSVMHDVEHPAQPSDAAGEGRFERVQTSQTHRPAPTTLVPESLDWRAVPDAGNLAQISFGAVLARLLHGRYTGSLRLWRQRVRKIVFLEQGRPVSVRSNLLYECLGNLLVRGGWIDAETSEASVARAQSEGRRQGEVLIEMGVIDEAELEAALRQQLEERLLDVFGWSEARYHLHDAAAPSESPAPTREATSALIARGVLERVSIERIIRELKPCLPYQLKLQVPDEKIAALELDQRHADVLKTLRDGSSLLELVARFEQSSQVYQVAYALILLGYVSLEA